jgi:hypothetical protein
MERFSISRLNITCFELVPNDLRYWYANELAHKTITEVNDERYCRCRYAYF